MGSLPVLLRPIKNQPKLVSYWPLFHYFPYVPVNNCFSSHKVNRTVATEVPIEAMSAIIAIFSSRENWIEHDDKFKLGRIVAQSLGQASPFLIESRPAFTLGP